MLNWLRRGLQVFYTERLHEIIMNADCNCVIATFFLIARYVFRIELLLMPALLDEVENNDSLMANAHYVRFLTNSDFQFVVFYLSLSINIFLALYICVQSMITIRFYYKKKTQSVDLLNKLPE